MRQNDRTTRGSRGATPRLMAALLLGAIALSLGPLASIGHAAQPAAQATIKVGDKGFTEEYLVADMYQLLLAKHGFSVQRHSYTSTAVAQPALRRGDIDLYPEYTGTGYATVLAKTQPITDAGRVYNIVKKEYARRFHLAWLAQSPMNDSQGFAVTQSTSSKYGLHTLSDLGKSAGKLKAIMLAECVGRADCLEGLKSRYGVNFKSVQKTTSTALNYKALLGGQADVSEVFTTDGQIPADHLVVLTDDKHLFPPYHVAPVVRQDTLRAHPQITMILNSLARYLTTQAIQKLNAQVDIQHQDHMAVARRFLKSKHLL